MASDPDFERYAVYFTLPDGPLASFAASWLGWDIANGKSVDQLGLPGVPLPTSVLTQTVGRYGFHATLLAPFYLAQGQSRKDVDATFNSICRSASPIDIHDLKLTALGRFLALVPEDQPDTLAALASRIVTEFAPLAAPISAADYDRKNRPSLTKRQRDNLKTFGASHVHEDFRFHMTLTDRLSQPHLMAVRDALGEPLEELLTAPLTLDALSLVGQAPDGWFRLIKRSALTG